LIAINFVLKYLFFNLFKKIFKILKIIDTLHFTLELNNFQFSLINKKILTKIYFTEKNFYFEEGVINLKKNPYFLNLEKVNKIKIVSQRSYSIYIYYVNTE